MGWRPNAAMVLAAGLGVRMRPLTDALPKPLVRLRGRALIDHVLDRVAAAGVATAVVNVHYLAGQIEAHLAAREIPSIVVSDERDARLDTGGGVRQALPHLGTEPFLVLNSDTVWVEGRQPNIERMIRAWDAASMDCLLLLAPVAGSLGYDGRGDFEMGGDGRLMRRTPSRSAPFVFAGVSLMTPRLFEGAPEGAFSLNLIWDRAIASGRLSGCPIEGTWMHIGSPAALAEAERKLAGGT
jgi:MurNAc alpha-1-phosphate uridylyltransferase